MGVAIFDKLMGFDVTDFPKTEVELTRFRCMLEHLRQSAVKDDAQFAWEDRFYGPLAQMELKDFPKSLKEHMEFNGTLLAKFRNKQSAKFLA